MKKKENISIPFRFYIIKNLYRGYSHAVLRGWLDDEFDFLEFCARNFDTITLMRNLAFDAFKEGKINSSWEIQTKRYEVLVKLLEFLCQRKL